VRVIVARVLHRRPQTLAEILEEVNRVLRRTEEARIYHWHKQHKKFPPRRRKPVSEKRLQ
jgi:hypothetical protein